MMLRVPQYPPPHARLIRRDEGPPMYRMLGYADENNIMSDLCDVIPPGFVGPFATLRLPPNQSIPFGASRFGLPIIPTSYTTVYYDDRFASCSDRYTPCNRMELIPLPEPRLEEILFPEMAIPGTGTQSRTTNDGFLYRKGLPPSRFHTEPDASWRNLNLHSGQHNILGE
ncbi:unnamed protein product [Candidula unifasciata]|uniref:Uncharacterized protein n=1 Tax=Candidula unifasciata TaxID=100452 RepID=A0A8S4ABP1_9EUPU|nr:unnamed protein product [Candidula unifasciata]